MMEYEINIEDRHFRVKIKSVSDEKAVVIVNDSTYDVHFATSEKQKSKPAQLVRKKAVLDKEKQPEVTGQYDDKKDSLHVIKAPLPGTVMTLNKKPGDEIKSGETLLVLEAMKMENNVISTVNGVVKEISVDIGDAVQEGAILARVG